MTIVPLTLAQANELVARLHRHHKPVVGHRFSIGLAVDGELKGAVIVGHPVARMVDHNTVAEVTRLVTDGTKNACSMLYAAAARAARAMGYESIQTYILEDEPGTSLRAAGWNDVGLSGGGDWERVNSRPGKQPSLFTGRINRTDQPMSRKRKWVKDLR